MLDSDPQTKVCGVLVLLGGFTWSTRRGRHRRIASQVLGVEMPLTASHTSIDTQRLPVLQFAI